MKANRDNYTPHELGYIQKGRLWLVVSFIFSIVITVSFGNAPSSNLEVVLGFVVDLATFLSFVVAIQFLKIGLSFTPTQYTYFIVVGCALLGNMALFLIYNVLNIQFPLFDFLIVVILRVLVLLLLLNYIYLIFKCTRVLGFNR